jgi:hypothetical protein
MEEPFSLKDEHLNTRLSGNRIGHKGMTQQYAIGECEKMLFGQKQKVKK